jgi:hypothetical protein
VVGVRVGRIGGHHLRLMDRHAHQGGSLHSGVRRRRRRRDGDVTGEERGEARRGETRRQEAGGGARRREEGVSEVQRQRQGQRGAGASSGVQRVACNSGWGWMRERRCLADLWPSCPWQVLEACRDPSVSPQLRTARPARAARHPGQHGISEGTSQGRAPARAPPTACHCCCCCC